MKPGQKVWFLDHVHHKLKEGRLMCSEDVSDRDECSTLIVKSDTETFMGSGDMVIDQGKVRVLKDWIFTTEREAQKGLRKMLRQSVHSHKVEIRRLNSKLRKAVVRRKT